MRSLEREAPRRSLTKIHRANISRGVKKVFSTPGMRTRLSEIQTSLWENPQRRQKQSEKQKELWQDPKHRNKMIASRTNLKLSEKHKKNISKALTGKPSPLRGRIMPEAHRIKISEAKKKRDKEARKAQEFMLEEADTEIDLNLWKAAIEENLIGPILNQNLLTKEEIGEIKGYFEGGEQPPEELMDKFSIAVARTA